MHWSLYKVLLSMTDTHDGGKSKNDLLRRPFSASKFMRLAVRETFPLLWCHSGFTLMEHSKETTY